MATITTGWNSINRHFFETLSCKLLGTILCVFLTNPLYRGIQRRLRCLTFLLGCADPKICIFGSDCSRSNTRTRSYKITQKNSVFEWYQLCSCHRCNVKSDHGCTKTVTQTSIFKRKHPTLNIHSSMTHKFNYCSRLNPIHQGTCKITQSNSSKWSIDKRLVGIRNVFENFEFWTLKNFIIY